MEYVTLGNYCSITSSKRIFAEQYVEKGVPFYRSKEIIEKNNGQDISEPLYIEPEVYETIKTKFGVPQKGDMLLTSVGTIGIPYIVKDEQFYFKDGNLTWMRNFSKELSSKYLYYWISSKFGRDSLVNRCIGSSQAALTIDILKNYKLFIPKREIQDEIVSILSAYDNLIENNNKRIKILEQMTENLYKEWFVRFRFPGHEITPLENGIPKGWKLKHVSEIGDIIGGGTPSTDNEEYWNGNIPWLSPADLTDYQGVYIDKGANNITELGLAKSSAKMMPKDTVLLSSRAPIGYVALAKNDICTNQGFKSIVCNQSIMKPSYLYLYFKLNKSYLQSFASGATFPELSGSMVKKLKVLVPDISLLEKFDTFAKKLFEKTDVLLTQNQNLIKQRDLLLPRLMSGKLAV